MSSEHNINLELILQRLTLLRSSWICQLLLELAVLKASNGVCAIIAVFLKQGKRILKKDYHCVISLKSSMQKMLQSAIPELKLLFGCGRLASESARRWRDISSLERKPCSPCSLEHVFHIENRGTLCNSNA